MSRAELYQKLLRQAAKELRCKITAEKTKNYAVLKLAREVILSKLVSGRDIDPSALRWLAEELEKYAPAAVPPSVQLTIQPVTLCAKCRSEVEGEPPPTRRKQPVEVRDVEFLRANTDRAIKITVPGPFTMSQQAQNDFYKDEQEMVLDYAAAVNAEIKDLFAAGADIVQIDEPYMQARPEKARQYGLRGLDAALAGVTRTTAIHICFGYAAIIHVRPSGYSFLPELAASPVQQISIETAQSNLDCSVLRKLPGKMIILGTLDLSDMAIESPETVAARIRRALSYVSADRIVVMPDCGLKYLPRDVAFGKMRAMVDGANIVRQELKAR